MSLKIYNLPLIMQEVDTVIEKYINIINELRRTSSQETYQVFVQLRDSVRKHLNFRLQKEYKSWILFMNKTSTILE